MLNKEFSNKIMICPADELPASIVTPFTGFDQIHSNIDIIPSIKQEYTRAGYVFNFKLRTVLPEDNKEILDKYQGRRAFVVLLFDTDGNHYQVGTVQTPVRTTIDPVRFVYELNMFASLLKSPL